MNRDMDLVRAILLKIEAAPKAVKMSAMMKDPNDAAEAERYHYHVGIMHKSRICRRKRCKRIPRD